MPTVLVVEDDAGVQQLIVELLREHGLDEVLPARSSHEALRLAADHTVDLVVLDHYLADSSGVEIAEQLRTLPGFNAPVLVTTALPRRQAEEVCAEADACQCVVKPFDIAEFLAAVDECLASSEEPAAA
jgi:CheY-like chemotaxis protein